MLQDTNGLEECINILNQDSCDRLIDMFNNDIRKTPGLTGFGVSSEYKISTELPCVFGDNQWEKYNKLIIPGIQSIVKHMKEKYSFIEWGLESWEICNQYNIQHYKDGEGYFRMHCEHSFPQPYRMMAWMIYLNDAECGTEFPYQNTVVKAERGKGVIWSAGWTHPHKGVTPNVGDKYIATGWFNFYKP